MANTEYLDGFEKILAEGLEKICKAAGLLNDGIMMTPDIESVWDRYLEDYVADAVENYEEYPDAAITWAAFLGMSVANCWDRDWKSHEKDLYQMHYGKRGFDDMDEHVVFDILGLSGETADRLFQTMMSCSQATRALMRHEGIAPMTSEEFYVLIRCYGVMFRLGVGLELNRLGYKKVLLGNDGIKS